jgi:DNA-binding Lrp family transcriptional regulator
VTECYSTTGESDYILKIVAPDIKAYDSFLHERIFKIPAVAQVRTSVVLREIKFDTQLPL